MPDDLVPSKTPCLAQFSDAYRQIGGNVIAVTEVPPEHTSRYSILDIGLDDGRLVEVSISRVGPGSLTPSRSQNRT